MDVPGGGRLGGAVHRGVQPADHTDGRVVEQRLRLASANYAPLVVGLVVLLVTVSWFGGVRNTFTGPRKTIKMEGDGLAVSGD